MKHKQLGWITVLLLMTSSVFAVERRLDVVDAGAVTNPLEKVSRPFPPIPANDPQDLNVLSYGSPPPTEQAPQMNSTLHHLKAIKP